MTSYFSFLIFICIGFSIVDKCYSSGDTNFKLLSSDGNIHPNPFQLKSYFSSRNLDKISNTLVVLKLCDIDQDIFEGFLNFRTFDEGT